MAWMKVAAPVSQAWELPAELAAEFTYVPEVQNPEGKTLYVNLQSEAEAEAAAILLMPTPGGIPVVFVTGAQQRRAPRNLWISPAFDEPALKARFGEAQVRLT
jgi:hypothetical protein